MFAFLQFVILFCLVSISIDFLMRSKPYLGPVSDHFDGKNFHNIMLGFVSPRPHIRIDKTSASVIFFRFILKHFDNIRWQKRPLPYGHTKPISRVEDSHITATFINHSTVLLQTEGLNILTDPIWVKRAGPFNKSGPARYMEPGVLLHNLPKIDIILLSHNHYDHMDTKTLRIISKRDRPIIYTPLGNTKYLRSRGIFGSIDMDWGQSIKFLETISIDCVPAQHFSGRGLSDRNTSLWAGFVIRTPHDNIYFSGDTAYGPFASHIARAYPDGFRFALLPIGAYEPEKFFSSAHMGPHDAVILYKDLEVREALAIHLGTFDLAFDAQDDPANCLKKILTEPENMGVNFHTLQNGEVLNID